MREGAFGRPPHSQTLLPFENRYMNSYDFRSRVAIITGGGQGIGLTFAERILASGGKVSV